MGEFAGRQFRGIDLVDKELAAALQVLEIEEGRIVRLTFFLDVETLFPRFGLPLEYAELATA